MIKYLLFFLLLPTIAAAQVDSSITYVNDTAKYKAIYDGIYSYFYRYEDNAWKLYGKWEDNAMGRSYYGYDSLGNDLWNFEEEWTEDIRYSYSVDNAGNMELVAYTKYYGKRPVIVTPTSVVEDIDGLTVYVDGSLVIIQAMEVMRIIVYDVEGRLLFDSSPYRSEVTIAAGPDRFLFIKIYYDENKYAVRKVLTSY